jgi:hypothetical protein
MPPDVAAVIPYVYLPRRYGLIERALAILDMRPHRCGDCGECYYFPDAADRLPEERGVETRPVHQVRRL